MLITSSFSDKKIQYKLLNLLIPWFWYTEKQTRASCSLYTGADADIPSYQIGCFCLKTPSVARMCMRATTNIATSSLGSICFTRICDMLER